MPVTAHLFSPSDAELWNGFVAESKNGTFMFDRNFMDYHSSRFEDHSLLFFDRRDRLCAVLPANRDGGTLESHGGLTFGGLVCRASMSTPLMEEVVDALIGHLRARGFGRLIYKAIPSIFHRLPAGEADYVLFQRGAQLVRRDVSSAIDYREPGKMQERRLRGVKRARQQGVTVESASDFAAFWRLLEINLKRRFGATPTHTQAEIELLHRRFPDKIILHLAKYEERPVAGVVLFVSDIVAHTQYVAASEEGRELGALDLLLVELIRSHAHLRYFSFGISTEDGGRMLNKGLIEQKEGFGSSAFVHDFYEFEI